MSMSDVCLIEPSPRGQGLDRHDFHPGFAVMAPISLSRKVS
jgi:hypothetical protein